MSTVCFQLKEKVTVGRGVRVNPQIVEAASMTTIVIRAFVLQYQTRRRLSLLRMSAKHWEGLDNKVTWSQSIWLWVIAGTFLEKTVALFRSNKLIKHENLFPIQLN